MQSIYLCSLFVENYVGKLSDGLQATFLINNSKDLRDLQSIISKDSENVEKSLNVRPNA